MPPLLRSVDLSFFPSSIFSCIYMGEWRNLTVLFLTDRPLPVRHFIYDLTGTQYNWCGLAVF